MSTSSADPAKLVAFTSGVAAARVSASDEQSSTTTKQVIVIAASPDYNTAVPALGSLATALLAMGSNETFVSSVQSALVAADRYSGGPATVSDERISSALAAAGVETPPAPTDVDPSTSIGLAPTSGFIDDPICAANGNMVHQDLDLELPAIAGALNLVRTWNSMVHDRPGAFGPGWSSVLDVRLDVRAGRVRAWLADGAAVWFERQPAGWLPHGRHGLRLEPAGDGWQLRTDHVRTFEFDAAGVLTGWTVGVAHVEVTHDGGGRVVGLHEVTTGRSLAVVWTGGHVESISTSDGRTLEYARDGNGVLTTVRTPSGWLDYRSEGALLASVVDPDGVAAFVNVYDDDGRVVEQTSPFGRTTTYRYDRSGVTVVTGADDGLRQAMVHDAAGNLVAVVDADGSAMRLDYDRAQRVVRVVERDGAVWRYDYDEHDDLVRRTDPDGLTHEWRWDRRHRLVGETDRAGAVWTMEFDTVHAAPSRVIGPTRDVASQELDERGLPTRIVDADGVATELTWDRDGQLVSTIDAAGREARIRYDERGLIERLQPAGRTPTELVTDATGRITRVQRGDEATTYAYSPAGRVVAGSEPGSVAWSATFGGHGAMASLADATGATVTFEHDALGNVVAVSAPDDGVYRNEYDLHGRHIAIIEPSGATTTKGYDGLGRLITFTDAEARSWRRQLDVLGRTVESTAPDGGVTRWTYHPGGEVATVTGPDGRQWRTEVDAEGRPTAVVDPTGGRSEIDYTAAGRISRRRSPAGRTERFEYGTDGQLSAVVGIDGQRRTLGRDGRGFVTEISGPDGPVGFEWDDGYRLLGITTDGTASTIRRDDGGRVVEQVDPTGVTARYAWDDRGLLASAVDPAGLASAYERDVRGRLAAHRAPGDRTITLQYDADGRTAAWTDPTGGSTTLHRDATGAMTGLRRADGSGWDRTLDVLGREIERLGVDGVVHGRFGYDASGRMTSATVPGAALASTFLWDDNDRLVEAGSEGRPRRIERDADGWVVATIDADGVRTTYVRAADGRIVAVRVDGDAPIAVPDDRSDVEERDRAGRLTIGPDGTVHQFDDAGRIVELAPPGATPTRFTYDDDGLVATEVGPHGRRRFAYDGAGRVVAVTVDGAGTTDIEYDLAGRRRREWRPDGSTVRYRWDDLDHLVAIETERADGIARTLTVTYDALGQPVIVGQVAVEHDPISGLPDRVGDHRYTVVGTRRYDDETGAWELPRPDRPVGGLPVDGRIIVGARVLDPTTHQFLTADPLLALAATNGASSAYTYAWHDPVNHVDPTGLRPISVEEYAAIRQREEQGRVGQAWEAIKSDPWGTLMMVGVVAVGVGLCLVPGGQAIGAGILIGAAISAGAGFATGNFNPREVAVGGAFGAIPGAATARGALLVGAAAGAGETVATSVLTGRGIPTGRQLLTATATAGIVPPSLSGAVPASVPARNLVPANASASMDFTPTPVRQSGGGSGSEPPVPNLVYRGGSRSMDNLTPRPGQDPTGLSTFDRPELAARPGEKVQVIDTTRLTKVRAYPDPPPDGHVSLRRDLSEIPDWAATRGTGQEHELTTDIKSALVDEFRLPKP